MEIVKSTLRVMLILMLVVSFSANATVKDLVFGDPVKKLQVPVGHSRILILDKHFTNMSVGDPRIADVIVLDEKKIYILGKALGSTNVVLWGMINGKAEHTTFYVDVTHDVESMKQILNELMPEEKPEIRSSQGAMVISGEVSSPAKVDAIERLATQFVNNSKEKSDAESAMKGGEQKGDDAKAAKRSTEVINLLSVGGPHQIMLEVKVAEISRSILKRMGVNLLGVDRSGNVNFGAVNGGASFPGFNQVTPSAPSIGAAGFFANYISKGNMFNIVLDASKENGLAKILAEPTLTTTSGEAASFLSGGEFPLPVWSGDNRITVTYKEYGIKMKALPVVLDSKKINIQMEIEVSELSEGTDIAAGVPGANFRYVLPSLTTRKTESTIDLMDGQTIGIAGLISDKMRQAHSQFPGLGDVPILGALFRSQEFISDQTELVMFVTARLAKPTNAAEIVLPTDSYEDPSDLEFYLLGSMQALNLPGAKSEPGIEVGFSYSQWAADLENTNIEQVQSSLKAANESSKGKPERGVNLPKTGNKPNYGHKL